MILVRIDKVKGDVAIPGYEDWFKATSFEFGVGREISASESSEQDLEVSTKKDQSLSIEKFTDAATVYLMQLAMKSRSQNAGSVPVCIDIHVIETRGFREGNSDVEKVRPYVLIRIENAFVTNWSLSGSDDDRPAESLDIWFSKAAIKYYGWNDSSKTFKAFGPVGWDQYDNVDFRPEILSRSN